MLGKIFMLKQPCFLIGPIIRPYVTYVQSANFHTILPKSFIGEYTYTPISSPSLRLQARCKHSLDTSLVPVLNESDLEEQYVTGSGPGGSNVNKNRNCVVLIHKPTGITVKCHLSRLLQDNRKLAREMLVNKLDEKLNGDMSLTAQKEKLLQEKSTKGLRKSKMLSDLKRKYQEFVANKSSTSSEISEKDNPESKEQK